MPSSGPISDCLRVGGEGRPVRSVVCRFADSLGLKLRPSSGLEMAQENLVWRSVEWEVTQYALLAFSLVSVTYMYDGTMRCTAINIGNKGHSKRSARMRLLPGNLRTPH